VSVDDAAPRAAVAAGLTEARLHGAWPLVDAGTDPAAWIAALDAGPTVVVVRGALPPALSSLPPL
jgi:hypothetical protein